MGKDISVDVGDAQPQKTPGAGARLDGARLTGDSPDLEVYPGSVSRSVWAKVKKLDAVFKTKLSQGTDRNQIVCKCLQDCFDLLAKETLKRNDDLEDCVERWVIQNALLEIAVALEWLEPPMAPKDITHGPREWLKRLLEGRVAYFESCWLGETPGDIDKLGYVVLPVPETNPLFQSEEALEALKTQFSQPPTVFDIETLKLHASNVYGSPPDEITPQQLSATIDALMRKYGSIKVTGFLARGPDEDAQAQSEGSRAGQAEPPMARTPPEGCISRPLGSADRLLAKLAARFSKVDDPRGTSAQPNQDAVMTTQEQPMNVQDPTASPAHEPEGTHSDPGRSPQEVSSANRLDFWKGKAYLQLPEPADDAAPRTDETRLPGTGGISTAEPLVKVIEGSVTKEPARKGGRPVILVDGERIKELRGEYSQVAFARFCKVSVDAVQLAEHHGRSSDKTISKIVRKLQAHGHKIKAKDLIKNPPQ
jgi:DNA-binding transcriptional regulator YiaG